jgi:hypothetical protein
MKLQEPRLVAVLEDHRCTGREIARIKERAN